MSLFQGCECILFYSWKYVSFCGSKCVSFYDCKCVSFHRRKLLVYMPVNVRICEMSSHSLLACKACQMSSHSLLAYSALSRHGSRPGAQGAPPAGNGIEGRAIGNEMCSVCYYCALVFNQLLLRNYVQCVIIVGLTSIL